MQQSALISVIVPVYNVEAYLKACISSIVNQSYPNLEILLIDDGSTDRSGEICDAWKARDGRIIVIHQANRGLSEARNAGLERARGAFIAFVDSDDFIAPEMYARLAERMIADGSDMCVCGYEIIREDGRSLNRCKNCTLDAGGAMHALLGTSLIENCVWNKLYRRDAIQGVRFPAGRHYEDVFWFYQIIARARKISLMDANCYFYRKRPHSITMQAYSPMSLHVIEGHLQRLDFIRLHFPECELAACQRLLCACIWHTFQSIKFLNKAELQGALALLKTAFRRSLRPRGEVYRRKPVRFCLCLWGWVLYKILCACARKLWHWRK